LFALRSCRNHKRRLGYFTLFLILASSMLTACAPAGQPSSEPATSKLKAMATTTIVGDVVKAIGGDTIDLTVLLPVGADPHDFEPTPQDVVKIAAAQVIFMNGAGLEEFIEPLLKNAGDQAKLVSVSEGIQLLDAVHGEEEEHVGGDPHVWFDPNNVSVWTENIEQTLSTMDPGNAAIYTSRASQYRTRLEELDGWIKEQIDLVSQANRKLVTDHAVFAYFARRYGLEQVGAVIPGYSTAAQPSARELAQLQDAIRALGVKAVFVGKTANPNLSKRVAEDMHIKLVFLYTGSLSEPGGPADTYLVLMRYNVTAIVEALSD